MLKGSHHTKEHNEYMKNKLKGRRPRNAGIKMTEQQKRKAIKSRIGIKSPHWKGDNVGYHALHVWVQRWKGKKNICERCGSIKSKKYERANINHEYKRILDDYIRMCTKCHREYDYENFGIPINMGKNPNSHGNKLRKLTGLGTIREEYQDNQMIV